MKKWMLAAGAAALAITSPALAQKGEKGGKGGGKENSGQAMKADRGGGGNDRGPQMRGGGRERAQSQPARYAPQQSDRSRGGKDMKAARTEDRGRGRDTVQIDRHGGDNKRVAKVDTDRGGKAERKEIDVVRGAQRGAKSVERVDRGRDDVRLARIDRDDDDWRFVPRWNDRGLASGFINGCPPGLAKKGNGCLPPGQAKKIVGTAFAPGLGLSALGGQYRDWYRDDDDYFYRWDDDYIYRVRREGNLIDALFPYENRDYYYYPMGAAYPDYFNYYNVPYQYRSYYPDGGDYWYRYGDGAIYMVDPQTQAISGIAALLTGNPLAVGQPLPPYYGVYNVPLSYRDRYYDTADAWYRYNDGYIYRVDPATQLITAVISALV